MDNRTIDLITRRRKQILLHSYLYYELNKNIIPDKQFDKWAYELKQLQEKYPEESMKAKYFGEFIGFNGCSGFDLPYRNPSIVKDAYILLNYMGIDV